MKLVLIVLAAVAFWAWATRVAFRFFLQDMSPPPYSGADAGLAFFIAALLGWAVAPVLTIWRLIGPWVLARLKAAADAEERRKPWGRW